jgi:hypothetical protein
MMRAAGLSDVMLSPSPPYWCAVGRRSVHASGRRRPVCGIAGCASPPELDERRLRAMCATVPRPRSPRAPMRHTFGLRGDRPPLWHQRVTFDPRADARPDGARQLRLVRAAQRAPPVTGGGALLGATRRVSKSSGSVSRRPGSRSWRVAPDHDRPFVQRVVVDERDVA